MMMQFSFILDFRRGKPKEVSFFLSFLFFFLSEYTNPFDGRDVINSEVLQLTYWSFQHVS